MILPLDRPKRCSISNRRPQSFGGPASGQHDRNLMRNACRQPQAPAEDFDKITNIFEAMKPRQIAGSHAKQYSLVAARRERGSAQRRPNGRIAELSDLNDRGDSHRIDQPRGPGKLYQRPGYLVATALPRRWAVPAACIVAQIC
jgi:hypothetical protein